MFLSEILQVLGLNMHIDDKKIKHIRTDSRLLKKGDVFICLNNGHNYIDEAIKKGVCAIIYEKDIKIPDKVLGIRVPNTIIALGLIAKHIRENYHGIVIAVTGSNGKSTTKEMLKHLLSKKYRVLSNSGSLNNHIGVPNTMLDINKKDDYVVLELGTNHPGEIKYLADIVDPDIALITNIGHSHIGNFGSKKKILEEKLAIKKPRTILFVNGEDQLLNKVDAFKVYAKDYHEYKTNYMMNEFLVYKVCAYLGYSEKEMYDGMNDFTYLPSRFNQYVVNGITIIDDAYNASYESVIYGLDQLKAFNRKIIVLGDMLELGSYSQKLHRAVFKHIKKMPNVLLLTIGTETKKLHCANHFDNLNDLITYFNHFVFQTGDVIYLKGAHKMGLSSLVNTLKKLANK